MKRLTIKYFPPLTPVTLFPALCTNEQHFSVFNTCILYTRFPIHFFPRPGTGAHFPALTTKKYTFLRASLLVQHFGRKFACFIANFCLQRVSFLSQWLSRRLLSVFRESFRKLPALGNMDRTFFLVRKYNNKFSHLKGYTMAATDGFFLSQT